MCTPLLQLLQWFCVVSVPVWVDCVLVDCFQLGHVWVDYVWVDKCGYIVFR